MDTSDWKYVSKHLDAHYSSSAELLKLFNYILKHKADLDSEKLQIDAILQKAFSNKSRKYVLNVMSQLYGATLSALAEKQFHRNKDLKQLTQFEVLQKRRLFAHADKLADSFKEYLEDDQQLNLWKAYYDLRFRFFRLFSNHPKNITEPAREEFIDDFIKSLSISNSILTLFLQAEIKSLSTLHSKDYSDKLAFIERFISPQEEYLNQLLEELSKLVDSPPDFLPRQILDTLFEHTDTLSDTLKTSFYFRLRRYFLLDARKGNTKYVEELSKIILWSSQHNELIEGMNTISPNRFLNDVNILCFLKEIDTASQYLESNVTFLEKEIKKQVESICKMMIQFSTSNFEEALFIYNTSAFKKLTYRKHAYSVMLKSLYELDNSNAQLEDQLRNFEAFMNRNKHKLRHSTFLFFNNFIKGYKYLIKDKRKLEQFLEQGIRIKDRYWLKEKLLEK